MILTHLMDEKEAEMQNYNSYSQKNIIFQNLLNIWDPISTIFLQLLPLVLWSVVAWLQFHWESHWWDLDLWAVLCCLHADINCIQIFPPSPHNTVCLIHYGHTDTVDVAVLYI